MITAKEAVELANSTSAYRTTEAKITAAIIQAALKGARAASLENTNFRLYKSLRDAYENAGFEVEVCWGEVEEFVGFRITW